MHAFQQKNESLACTKPTEEVTIQIQKVSKKGDNPLSLLAFWLFYLTALVHSLIKSLKLSKDESDGVALSPSYRFLLSFIILLASVCRPTIPESHHGKKSHSHNEVVIFEEPINAIKSKPLAGSVDVEIINLKSAPIVSSSLEDTWRNTCDINVNGNSLFPTCSKADMKYELVGMGNKPVESYRKNKYGEKVWVPGCGDYIVTHIAADVGKVYHGPHKCNRKSCPVCYIPWLKERSDVIVNRILCPNALNRNFGYRLVTLYVSMSPDEAPETLEELNMIEHDMYDWIKSKGLVGAASIFHPWRATDEAKKLSHDANMSTWAWVRSQPNYKRYVKTGPHLHMVGYIKFLEPNKSGDRFNYGLKTNDSGSPIDFRGSPERLGRFIEYILTHTVDVVGSERFDSIRWFGSLAANQFETNMPIPETLQEEGERHKAMSNDGELTDIWTWRRSEKFDAWKRGEIEYSDENNAEIQNWLDGGRPYDNACDYVVSCEGEPPPIKISDVWYQKQLGGEI